MNVILFAYQELGAIGIQALENADFNLTAVFTEREPAISHDSISVAKYCAEKGIPVFAPEDINSPVWVDKIRSMAPELIFSFEYPSYLGPEILAIPTDGAFALHPSLLPRYRGKTPLSWALANGEQEAGITLYEMGQDDSGAIMAQQPVAIEPSDDLHSLKGKVAKAAATLLNEQLLQFHKGGIQLQQQDENEATCFDQAITDKAEINWQRSAEDLYNQCRALTAPLTGAFSHCAGRKTLFWQTRVLEQEHSLVPGTVVSTDPLQIACGKGVLEVVTGQVEDGLYLMGQQLAQEIGLVPGSRFEDKTLKPGRKTTRVLILGVNGFIGYHLTERLLKEGNYEVYGMDIGTDAVGQLIGHPRFHFVEGDITIHNEWMEYHIKKCDVILPLVAIATPVEYTRNPIKVFELDFEENLKIVRDCVRYKKRIIFPSTSEVYGMCDDELFDEDNSRLIVGPINKQRWIYSVSKQLLDRVIWAYGQKEGLEFTLFRPFNWMGPRLDRLDSAKEGCSRAITQLILNLVEGTPIKLVDGGEQKRCFTDIEDGIEALFRIVKNENNHCNGQIINIGNPDNEASIRELAEMLVEQFEQHPLRHHFPPFAGLITVDSRSFYGKGYQDVSFRRPSINNLRKLLSFEPSISVETSVAKTLDFFLNSAIEHDK